MQVYSLVWFFCSEGSGKVRLFVLCVDDPLILYSAQLFELCKTGLVRWRCHFTVCHTPSNQKKHHWCCKIDGNWLSASARRLYAGLAVDHGISSQLTAANQFGGECVMTLRAVVLYVHNIIVSVSKTKPNKHLVCCLHKGKTSQIKRNERFGHKGQVLRCRHALAGVWHIQWGWYILGGVNFGPFWVDCQWMGVASMVGVANQRSRQAWNHWSSNTTSHLFQRQRSMSSHTRKVWGSVSNFFLKTSTENSMFQKIQTSSATCTFVEHRWRIVRE